MYSGGGDNCWRGDLSSTEQKEELRGGDLRELKGGRGRVCVNNE